MTIQYIERAAPFPLNPIASLYTSREQGAWLDPSDLSTMFQDAAGTAPVTADGQPVGLIRDKSGNGNHASQATTASRPTYKTDGSLHWLQFDGVDDYLSIGAVDLSANDELTVMAGQLKKSTTVAILTELGPNANSNNGTFYLAAPVNSNPGYGFAARGSTPISLLLNAGYPSPDTSVVVGLSKISAPSAKLRVNGVDKASTGATLGSGNFASTQPLYIGRRNGATIPFNGNLYGLIVRGAMTADPMLSQAENWMASKAGVSL